MNSGANLKTLKPRLRTEPSIIAKFRKIQERALGEAGRIRDFGESPLFHEGLASLIERTSEVTKKGVIIELGKEAGKDNFVVEAAPMVEALRQGQIPMELAPYFQIDGKGNFVVDKKFLLNLLAMIANDDTSVSGEIRRACETFAVGKEADFRTYVKLEEDSLFIQEIGTYHYRATNEIMYPIIELEGDTVFYLETADNGVQLIDLRKYVGGVEHFDHITLVMADVDYFTSYNNAFGHEPGDEILRNFGPILQASASKVNGLAARFGGEEFLIMYPVTKEETAEIIEKEVWPKILAIPTGGVYLADDRKRPDSGQKRDKISASFGLAACKGDYVNAFVHADKMMYEAKRLPGNSLVAINGGPDNIIRKNAPLEPIAEDIRH